MYINLNEEKKMKYEIVGFYQLLLLLFTNYHMLCIFRQRNGNGKNTIFVFMGLCTRMNSVYVCVSVCVCVFIQISICENPKMAKNRRVVDNKNRLD